MNYIILYATAVILKIKKSIIKIFFASFLGSLYAVVSMLEICNFILFKIFISIIIVCVAFQIKNIKSFLKYIFTFYLVSFTFGGISLALLYILKPENILMRNGVYVGTYPIKIVLLAGILGYMIFNIAYFIIKNKQNKNKKICKIELILEKKHCVLDALIDTGNLLKEPITGTPVIVVENRFLQNIIPKEIIDNIEEVIFGNLKNIISNEENKKFIKRFRIIPFNSLGKENGLLLGIKFDELKVLDEEEKRVENIIVALYDKKISKERNI